jgi:hypothetical protein
MEESNFHILWQYLIDIQGRNSYSFFYTLLVNAFWVGIFITLGFLAGKSFKIALIIFENVRIAYPF